MTQIEVSIPGRKLAPLPLERPARRCLVPKVPASQNGHVTNFNCIPYGTVTSELHPLEALEFYLLKSHSI